MSSSISASDRRRVLRAACSSGAWRSLVVLCASVIVPMLAYAGLFVYQIGSGPEADWWLNDIMRLRAIFYREALDDLQPGSSKVLIVGGSASLFGVNSARIEDSIGKPTLNLGLHAGLDIDLLMAQALDYADANDLVVVPLEFELYLRDKPSDLTPRDFFAFFYRFADKMPLKNTVEFVVAASPSRIVQAAFGKMMDQLRRKAPGSVSDETLLANWAAARTDPDAAVQRPYSFATMTRHGDKDLRILASSEILAEASEKKTPSASHLESFPLDQLIYWRDSFERRGARFVLTWPVILQDRFGTVFTEDFWSRQIGLAREMASHGLPIYCDPIAAIVPSQYRFDSVYHVNLKGARIYSDSLAACITDGAPKPFDYETADPAELARRAQERIDSFRVPKPPFVFDYERNLNRLAALDGEIRASHALEGTYPAELPATADGVWYRSDGHDFKLLIEDPKECYVVAFADPERIDPVRGTDDDCAAYGYWTPGAAGW